ncbi:MAG TPA: murein biosynthesis integral membrane protein MurJ [Rhabdochlamydiaceae bacterium]|nr:murein biosynthesis integral membrane protein MurJ [Rhabdochlamydiaceae bacterium]
MDQPKTVVKSAAQFFFGTVLSRFSGFFREMALGYWFGATPIIAAFLIAYRFSQLLRRLFGESSLLSSFSPHFEALRAESPEKAAQFFRDLFASLSTFLFLLIVFLETVLFLCWKWGGASQIIFLTMVMLPGVIFVCLYALFCALLQSEKKYFIPSAAPILFNIVFLIAMWWVKDLPQTEATLSLSIGVSLAFFVQWVAVLPPALPFLKGLNWFKAHLFAPELRQMVAAMTFTIIGVGAVQINSVVDSLFARYADLSGPAYLYYAIRLYQLPLALFGIALSSALLPPLSRAFQQNDQDRYKTLLDFALTRSFGFIFPMMIGIFVVGDSLVNLTYGRGAFDAQATLETTTCLWGYALGLVPAVFVLLLAPAFYAQKDFKTPLYGSLWSVLVNFLLNLVMIFGLGWGSTSVAIATSLAACVNCFYLTVKLSKKMGPLFDKSTLLSFAKVSLCALLAGGMTTAIGHYLVGGSLLFSTTIEFPRSLLQQLLHFFVLGGTFGLLFFSYAWMLRVREVFQFLNVKDFNSPN